MPVLNLSFISSLSYIGACNLLLQEGYMEENTFEEEDAVFDKKFITPYSLNDVRGQKIDCIYYVEYCNEVLDTQYVDGRMTWEDIEIGWLRQV